MGKVVLLHGWVVTISKHYTCSLTCGCADRWLSEFPEIQLRIIHHDPFSSLGEEEFKPEGGNKFISFKKYESVFCLFVLCHHPNAN